MSLKLSLLLINTYGITHLIRRNGLVNYECCHNSARRPLVTTGAIERVLCVIVINTCLQDRLRILI